MQFFRQQFAAIEYVSDKIDTTDIQATTNTITHNNARRSLPDGRINFVQITKSYCQRKLRRKYHYKISQYTPDSRQISTGLQTATGGRKKETKSQAVTGETRKQLS